MLKIYCQDCGSPTTYSNIKPKFCSSCGKPFEKTTIVNQVQLQKPTITKIKKPILNADDYDYDNEDDYDGEDVEARVPNIKKIDFEIGDLKPTKIKMKDIVSNIPEEALVTNEKPKSLKNNKMKKINKIKNQEFINQFKAEAGTLRPSRTRNKTDG